LLTAAESGRLRVVLVSTRNPLNIGAAARAMANFGFSRLRAVKPFEPSFREAKSAVGAADILARAEQLDSVAEAVSDCALVVGTTAATRREIQHPLKPLDQAGRLIRNKLRSGPVAVLFGSEKRGLTNEDFSHCNWLMRIPTGTEQPSMNLGQAVAVTLYEIARGASTRRVTSKSSDTAQAGEVERITGMLLDALRESGHTKPRATGTEEKIRRLVRRMDLQADDAEVWLGIWRQILWKVRAAK
jgi:TrmH family RNA methyltransferase